MVVDEDLEKVFNSNDLLRTEFKVTILLSGKMTAVRSVINHGFNDAESYVTYVFKSYGTIVASSLLNHGDLRTYCCVA